MVERYVRDVEAAGSNPVTPIFLLRYRKVRNTGFAVFLLLTGVCMNTKKFSDAMSELDDRYIDEALNYKKKAKQKTEKPGWIKWVAMAACLAVVLTVGVFAVNRQRNQITLSDNSANVTVCYTGNPFIFTNSSESLIPLLFHL